MPSGRAPPPSVARLSQLQRARFTSVAFEKAGEEPDFVAFEEAGEEPDPPDGGLPAGPWAAGLRQLGASYDTLLLSSEALAAAGQLEQLDVCGGDFGAAPTEASKGFWQWCRGHAPLQSLYLLMDGERLVHPSLVAALRGLRDARPRLRVWAAQAAKQGR